MTRIRETNPDGVKLNGGEERQWTNSEMDQSFNGVMVLSSNGAFSRMGTTTCINHDAHKLRPKFRGVPYG